MNSYATMPDLRRYLGLTGAQTSDDALLWDLLGASSRLIEAYTGRRFYPARASYAYTVRDPGLLLLGDDLLSLDTLTNGDGSAITDYHLHPARVSVKSSIALDRAQTAFVHDGDPVDAITAVGIWGFHPDWAQAWANSGDTVQNNPLAAGATTLTVSDADAVLPTGYGARFAAGQLLRLDDEYAHLLAVNATTNTLTVARGVNGTPATSHAQGTPVETYQVPADIEQVCLRVAAWLYKQRDAGYAQAAGGLRGQIAVLPALPPDVEQTLAPYARVGVGG
jgi:hypothetical protein